ncbi:MAG: hypothetical protein LQ351_007974 [Letrouitia transgressa]|nr:MAG: hypothetical protein LQ351_007974 [Letrouitia transgressa]
MDNKNRLTLMVLETQDPFTWNVVFLVLLWTRKTIGWLEAAETKQLLLEAFGYQDYPSEAIQKPDTAALAQNLGIPPSLVTETYSHLHRWLPIRCPENRQEEFPQFRDPRIGEFVQLYALYESIDRDIIIPILANWVNTQDGKRLWLRLSQVFQQTLNHDI